jgi:hypothetical protein
MRAPGVLQTRGGGSMTNGGGGAGANTPLDREEIENGIG